METELYLIRHGLPRFPAPGRYCLGRTDWPLCGEGEAQARRAAAYFSGAAVDAVWHSGLSRSRRTAEIIAGGAFPLRQAPDLAEVDFGPWDGKSFAEIQAGWPELFAARETDRTRFPAGAEPLEAAADRGLAALRRIAAAAQTPRVVLVVHQTLMHAMTARLRGRPIGDCMAEPIPYGSITRLRWDGQRLTLDYVGRDPGDCPPPAQI